MTIAAIIGQCPYCMRDDDPDVSSSALNGGLTAEQIVKRLADWSNKYPRQGIYGMCRKEKIDGELIDIEKLAVAFVDGC